MLFFESYEDNICTMLAEIFAKGGAEVCLETSFEACVARVRIAPPDAVVMIANNTHEGTLGFCDLANQIRAASPSSGFVFLAGCEMPDKETFLKERYRLQIHQIPCPIQELAKLIRAACDSPLDTFVPL